MTPAEFRAIRLQLGLTLEQWGRALGRSGDHVRNQINAMEGGRKEITLPVARLAHMYGQHGVPPEFLD